MAMAIQFVVTPTEAPDTFVQWPWQLFHVVNPGNLSTGYMKHSCYQQKQFLAHAEILCRIWRQLPNYVHIQQWVMIDTGSGCGLQIRLCAEFQTSQLIVSGLKVKL